MPSRSLPHLRFLFYWLCCVASLFAIDYFLNLFSGYSFWLQLILFITIATFFLFAIDKIQAMTHRQRIPEYILYITTFLGGSAGAIMAMILFRHKTKKIAFHLVLASIFLLQLIIGYLVYLNFF